MHIHTYTQTRAHVILCVYRGVHAHTHAHTQVHMHACVRPSQPILTVSTASSLEGPGLLGPGALTGGHEQRRGVAKLPVGASSGAGSGGGAGLQQAVGEGRPGW